MVLLGSGSRAKVVPNKVATEKSSANLGFLFQEGTSGQQPGLGRAGAPAYSLMGWRTLDKSLSWCVRYPKAPGSVVKEGGKVGTKAQPARAENVPSALEMVKKAL